MNAPPLRLAVYGFVEKEAGGLASANFVLLEKLAQREHFIDFYAVDPWVRPADLFVYPNFRYCGTTLPGWDWGWKVVDRVPTRSARWGMQMGYSQFTTAGYNRAIGKAIDRADRAAPYDALLTLGLLSPFRVTRVPTVSWTQGTPNGEREGLLHQKDRFMALCGRPLFLTLDLFYRWREFLTRRELRRSQYVICGSQWALTSWVELGLDASRVFPLAYPLDLDLFKPAGRPSVGADQAVELLHLGRLVPRKRLDLLLEAYQLLLASERNVHLRIIGAFAYGRGYEKLLKEPRLRAGVTYQDRVPRDEARAALERADVLVQPSENENFGTAVAEAQASGLPVVLGPTNGTKDYIDTDEFAFPTYEPAAVAAAMGRAVAAVRTRREQLARSARAAAERHFHVDGITTRLEEILRGAAVTASAARAPVMASAGDS